MKNWSAWKKMSDGLYVRTKGKYPAIEGATQFKFTKGIDRKRTGYGDVLTARQRAIDWRRGTHKTKYIKTSQVRQVKGGYLYTVRVFAGSRRKRR